MANKTISQRISLEGGAEFRSNLKALGDAGQQAFKSVSDAVSTATTVAAQLAPTIDQIQKKFTDLKNSAGNVGSKFSEAGSKFREAGERLTLVAGAVLGAEGGFAALIISSAKAADGIVKAAAAAGLATDTYQNMSAALGVAGIESSEIDSLIKRMNKTFGQSIKDGLELAKSQRKLSDEYLKGKISATDFAQQQQDLINNAKEDVNVFNRLGVSASKAMNDPHEAILQLVDALHEMPKGIEASALAIEVFRNAKFAAVALEGRDAFLELEKEMRRLAPPLSEVELAVGTKLKDTFEKFLATVDNTRLHFFTLFGPDTTTLIASFTEAIVNNRDVLLEFGKAIVAALQPAIEKVAEFARTFKLDPKGFDDIITKIKSFATDVGTAITILIGIWNGFVDVLQLVADAVNKVFGTKFTGQAIAIALVIASVTGVFGALVATIGAVVSIIGFLVTAFGGLNLIIAAVGFAIGFIFGQLIIDAVGKVPALIQSAMTAISDGFNGTINNIKNLWSAGVDFLSNKWAEFKDFVLSSLSNIGARIKTALADPRNSGDGGVGRAGGGAVYGPGTSTSDSIRAWLSNGEFVIKARAVQHYGAGFFSALNQMRVPSPGFALGGLVNSLDNIMPRRGYADGGFVTALAPSTPSGRPVILKIGDQSFGPMAASEDTVTRLERFAAGKQIRSAGRKPSWT